MAYAERFRFTFDSQRGLACRISILQDGYTGNVVSRPMGAGPVLRMDNGGAVKGTSLELTAECQVNREYAVLYTSSAREFKVEFYVANALAWSGFVSPELYSEPDIAPPYDVKVTATDGLGELKLAEFEAEGSKTLLAHLTSLLAHTGITRDIIAVSSLKVHGSSAASMLSSVNVNLDHMAGQSCYDVLTAILDTLNATITLNSGVWVIIRATDVEVSQGMVYGFDASSGDTVSLPVKSFGSLQSHSWWPIGQMETQIVPAKKGQTVAAPNHYKDSGLVNSDMSSDSGWTKTGGATYSSSEAAYSLPSGATISQALTFEQRVGYRLALRLRARNVGTTASNEQPLTLKIKIAGEAYGGDKDYYLSNNDRSGGTGTYMWLDDSDARVVLELPSPQTSDTEADASDFEIILPLHRNSARDYIYANSVEVTVENAGEYYTQYVYSCYLLRYEQSTGWEKIVEISNGARGAGNDLEIIFPYLESVAGASEFQYGVPAVEGEAVQKWDTAQFSELDFLGLIARDLAVGFALPRVQKTGTLNVPVSGAAMPLLYTDYEDLYIADTVSWDIYNDEIDVTLLSVPDASITVASEVVKELPANYSSSSGGSGSSYGGGFSDYEALANLPQINGIVLKGNQTANALGLIGNDYFELDDTTVPGKVFIKAKYDGLYTLGSLAAGGPGTSGGGGSSVVWTQIQGSTGSTKIATIEIDGESQDVYAPSGGGGSLALLSDVTLGALANYDVLFHNNGAWRNIPFTQLLNARYVTRENVEAEISANWLFSGNACLDFNTYGAVRLYGSYVGGKYRLNLDATDGLWINGVKVTGGGSTVSWGTESDGGVPLTVDGTAKTLALKSALSSYLPLAGGTMTGTIIPNSTSVNLGSSAKPWGEIHANKWYPNVNDTTHYIEYTTNGFVVHGNIAASGQVAAGA